MDLQGTLACGRIIKKLLRRPVSRLFWDNADDILSSSPDRPQSLHLISDRLQNGYYSSPTMFIDELTQMFQSCEKVSSKNSMRPIAARILLQDLSSAVSDLALNGTPYQVSLSLCENALRDASKNVSYRQPPKVDSQKRPSANIFSKGPQPPSSDLLSQYIQQIKSPELIVEAAAYSHFLQPESVGIGRSISFRFGIMTNETIEKLCQWVYKKLEDCADGRIDPLQHESATKLCPVQMARA